MEFNKVKNILELIKLSEFGEEDPEDLVFDQFINHAKVIEYNPQPIVENTGIGPYEYGGAPGFDEGSNILILEGDATIETEIDILPLCTVVGSQEEEITSETLQNAVNQLFLSGDRVHDTEYVIEQIMGDDGKPRDLSEMEEDLYKHQNIQIKISKIEVKGITNGRVQLLINIIWE